jgi:hypothetical protein
MSNILTPNDLAEKILDEYHDEFVYETAINLLYALQQKHYCIWQTYTKDDIKLNTGKRPSNEKMDDLQDRLENTFANNYLTD